MLGSGGTSGSKGTGVELGAILICESPELSAGCSVGTTSGNGVTVAAIVGGDSVGTTVGVSSATVATTAGSADEQATSPSVTSATAMDDNQASDRPSAKARRLS